MRKAIVLALAAAMLLASITGCAQSDTQDEVTMPTETQEVTRTPEEETEAVTLPPEETSADVKTTTSATTAAATVTTTVTTVTTVPTTVTTVSTTAATASETTASTTAATTTAAQLEPRFLIADELEHTQNLGYSVPSSLARAYKNMGDTNPISSNRFFADPTAIEYNGRLYVYGTCDQQEFIHNNGQGSNTYGSINSLACYSTDDMRNWTYHGDIPVGEITGWAWCSWAPSIVSRETSDGTEFFLYFANSGGGIGVLTSDSPTGPWEDPLGRALLAPGTAELASDPVCWLFDPGVCIDDDGVGWMIFGGGTPMHDGETGLYTGNCRIVRLGSDMISLGSEIKVIDAPYHFEANEINYIDGKYIFTYCSNWEQRSEWPSKYSGYPMPEMCTMCYMVTDDPLDVNSWEYRGEYIKNPTGYGYPFSNNHTHLQKFGDKYYIFYQNVLLLRNMAVSGADGYRSVGVDELEVDEKNSTYAAARMTDSGASQIKSFDPYKVSEAETSNVSAGIDYSVTGDYIAAIADDGSWIGICGADFKDGASAFAATVKGNGVIEIRLDSEDGEKVGELQFDSPDNFSSVYCELDSVVTGEHDLYLIAGGSFEIDCWQFA